jgi:hypothetical protein
MDIILSKIILSAKNKNKKILLSEKVIKDDDEREE